MSTIIPNLGLAKKNDLTLDEYATDVLNAVPLVFPVTSPAVEDVLEQLLEFREARKKVKYGNPSLTEDRNTKRRTLCGSITELAYDCSKLAGDDEVKFLACDIAIKRKPVPKGALTAPENLRLTSLVEGAINGEINSVAGGTTYLWFIGEDNTSPASFKLAGTSTDTRFTFEDLISGTRYYVFVYATGSRKKKGPPSATATKICS